MKLFIVMYHYVRDLSLSRYPNIKGLDLSLFKQQIDFLRYKFQIITPQILLEVLSTGKQLSGNLALLTFDDGYIDHFTNVFPILVEHGLSAIFSVPGKILKEGKLLDVNKLHFILASTRAEKIKARLFELLDYSRGKEFVFESNFDLYQKYGIANRFDSADVIFIKRILQVVLDEKLRNKLVDELFLEFVGVSEIVFSKELYMSMDQIRLMKNHGMHFAIHGYNHSWLGELPPKKMQEDIEQALDVFDGVINPNHWIMCYPYGSYSSETLDYLKTQNCVAGLTTEVKVATIPTNSSLELPRLDTNDFYPKSERYLLIE